MPAGVLAGDYSLKLYAIGAYMLATVETCGSQSQEIWAALSSIDLKLLEEIAFLCRLRAKESPSGKPWCHPGRKYLAAKLRRSVVTISRHVSKLKHLGILDAFQPRPDGGHWRTNVYRLRSRRSWRLARIGVLIERVAHRIIPSRSQVPIGSAKCSTFDTRPDFQSLYRRWMARGIDAATNPEG